MKNRKGLYIALGLSGALLILIIILCVVISGRVKQEVNNTTPTMQAKATDVPQITQKEVEPTKVSDVVAVTNTPTSTPTATPTTAPTDTPVPTATDTPVPTATPTLTPAIVTPLAGEEIVYPEKDPNREPRVIIDPGHGGYIDGAFDGGTNGGRAERKDDGSRWWESDITYEIALFVKQQLEADGVEVIMTRDDSFCINTVKERKEYADSLDIDCYVSIHLNTPATYDDTKTSGTEVLINTTVNKASRKLAAYVLDETLAKTGSRNRQVKERNDLAVLKTRHPSCLIECEFMSSDEKFPLLLTPEYQELTATGITNGIIKFLDYLGALK